MSLPISVIMPVYNGNNYMEETIQNVLSQSFQDFEFVIINDGSLDNTSDIIHRYANLDKRIVVIDRKYNIGFAKSFNQAVPITRGKYIASIGHDDLMANEALEEVDNFFTERPEVSVCSGQFIKIFGTENRIKKLPHGHNMIKYIHTPFIGLGVATCYFRREVLLQFSWRDLYGPASDMDLIARILMNSNARVDTIPKTLYHFRKHEDNYSKNTFTVIKNQILIQLNLLQAFYKAPIDPIIKHTIRNLSTLNKDTLLKTQNAITKISNHLDRNYSEKMNIDLGSLWNNRCRFLLEAS